MKNKILALLAVAAVGGLASAQVTIADTQPVGMNVAVDNSFEITGDEGAVFTLGTPKTNELTYSTNDGEVYSITASAAIWTTNAVGTVANYPVLTAAGDPLISNANVPTSVVLAENITNVDVTTLDVPLEVTSADFLLAGDYNTTVTYTFE